MTKYLASTIGSEHHEMFSDGCDILLLSVTLAEGRRANEKLFITQKKTPQHITRTIF